MDTVAFTVSKTMRKLTYTDTDTDTHTDTQMTKHRPQTNSTEAQRTRKKNK